MEKHIVYEGPYTLTNDGLMIGSDKTIFKYLLVGKTFRFMNNDSIYIINIREEPFIISGKTMIVTYNFNNSLEKFGNVLKNITKLVFDCINMNGAYRSRFNQPIVLVPCLLHVMFGCHFDQPLILNQHLLCIVFGNCFDQPIVLTPHIEYLTFGDRFNQPIVLTKHLKCITFGYNFNKPIVLTQRLEHLTFGCCFNQPIVLTLRLTRLTFGGCFIQSIILTPYIQYLTYKGYYNQPIILTSRIQNLTIGGNNWHIIDNLSNNIKSINIERCFELPLNHVPSSVKKVVICDENYKYNYTIEHLLCDKNL